jgi:hypothetical protein
MNLPRLQELLEATASERESAVRRVLRTAERFLPAEARYKQWDVDPYDKTVYWVTQETDKAKDKLAALLTNAGITGWTVKVTIRDDYVGQDDDSLWETAVS